MLTLEEIWAIGDRAPLPKVSMAFKRAVPFVVRRKTLRYALLVASFLTAAETTSVPIAVLIDLSVMQ
ncbi:hypothetical protein N7454_001739 [Penicillium verhagenii]|nr:hypothetical protein N7454_001739 [Penicillium verhagenii]